MAITDIFYTEECSLMTSITSTPNEWGIVEQTYEVIAEGIPCCASEVSSRYVQQTYGITMTSGTEISFDLDESIDCSKVRAIQYNGAIYEVADYRVYQEFLILPTSATFVCKRSGK